MPDKSDWVIRDVPEQTRRDIKAYAAKRGMTIGRALTELIQLAHYVNGEPMSPVEDISNDPKVREQLERWKAMTAQDRE